ncbi:type II CRISPR RNA-guided endonuclease Cas9 [Methanimicrococcus hongohii]|nr:type II CRISPR RNA-guided endonuclease Cas9 [Methanimicrococcus sp. Hf6]
MVKKVFDDYYLGLDIGTDSVGWAVTDKNYNILNFNGKAMWGIHLFDQGKTAEERRTHRTARRRLERRKQRIKLLQDIFRDEMNKTDPLFFERLKESRFHVEDRANKNHDTLFNDPSFKDKEYFKKYPTIYHLRNDLMGVNEKPDIRLLYLACHHIVKYRGHFLFEGLSNGELPEFDEIFTKLIETLNQECGTEIESAGINNDVKEILTNKNLGVNEKKRELQKIIVDEESSNTVKEFCSLISGGTANLDKLFEIDNEDSKLSLSFKNTDYDEKRAEYENRYFEKTEVLDCAKAVYDWALLSDILGEYHSISKSKVASYEQHEADLKLLKSILKENPEKYKEMFKSDSKGLFNYTAYSKYSKFSKNNQKNNSEYQFCTQNDFCKYLRNVLKEELAQQDFQDKYPDLVKRIVDDTFMPKQTNKDNSLFPNALHIHELKTILNTASNYYPFLKETDETGFNPAEKIEKLGTFRIPYYVGPLQANPFMKSNKAWLVRKEDGPITPWNFEDKVDLDKSGNEFMNRLIGNCTYLPDKKVVPKSSLMYQRYMLYNELNTLKINGERLFKVSPSLKHKMISDIFEKSGSTKVTKKKIELYITKNGKFSKVYDEIELSGVDDGIKSSLKSEIQLKEILGQDMNRNIAEEIIRTITVFGDERSRLKKKLEKDYSDKLTSEQIEKLSNIRFKDWGRLSEEFLTGVYAPIDGRDMNILEALENTSLNLMELLSDDYGFKKEIDKLNETNVSGKRITYDLVEDLYVSPPVKRGIWRTLRIIEDILKVTEHPPVKVFIETTRENQESKRTVSRKNKLSEAYKKCSEGNNELIEALNKEDEGRLRRKDLFLYYSQQGKCMYCGEKIDLNDLGNKNSRRYDIDHIHPRSLKMDDSIHNNFALVCSKHNQEKGKDYPLKPEWQNKMKTFWTTLKDKGFITKEKYDRLIRIHEFEDDELSGFINRQLVETSQSVKAVSKILETIFDHKTEVVYVKANTVSDFRNGNNGSKKSDSEESLKFIKCRSVNDYHHAKDAYLNIVVGNVYNTKFTKDPKNFITGGGHYNLRTLFSEDVKRGDVQAWTAGPQGTIATVQKYMKRNNILFTKFVHEDSGMLFKITPQKKYEGSKLNPLKKDLSPEKYGGYTGTEFAYFVLIDYKKGKKIERKLEAVPVYAALKNSEQDILNYFISEGYNEPKIVLNKIKKGMTFKIADFKLFIAGRSDFTCGTQLILSQYDEIYCKEISKYAESIKERKTPNLYNLNSESNIRLYEELLKKFGSAYNAPFYENVKNQLTDAKEVFESKDIETQVKVLNEILKIFSCKPARADLSAIGCKATGRIELSNPLKWDVKLIHQSPSGLFENEINLKEL